MNDYDEAHLFDGDEEEVEEYFNQAVAAKDLLEAFKYPPGVDFYREVKARARRLREDHYATDRIYIGPGPEDTPYNYEVYPDGYVKEGRPVAMTPDVNIGVTISGGSFIERVANLQKTIEQLEATKAFFKNLPAEPASDAGNPTHLTPVVYFEKQFPGSGKVYQYAFLGIWEEDKEQRTWYGTGPKAPKGYTWEELLLWLIESSPELQLPVISVSFVEDWAQLYPDSTKVNNKDQKTE